MGKITSRRQRKAPKPPQIPQPWLHVIGTGRPRIIINPDGTWTFPESNQDSKPKNP